MKIPINFRHFNDRKIRIGAVEIWMFKTFGRLYDLRKSYKVNSLISEKYVSLIPSEWQFRLKSESFEISHN